MYKYFFKKLPWVFVSLLLLNACGNVDNDDAGRANTLQSAAAAAPTTKSKADRIKAVHTALQSPKLKGKVYHVWTRVLESWEEGNAPFAGTLISSTQDVRTIMDRLAAASGGLDSVAQQDLSAANFDAKSEYDRLTAFLPLEEIVKAAKQIKKLASVRPSAGTLTEDEARGRKPYIFVGKDEVKQLTGKANLTTDTGNGTGTDSEGNIDSEVKGKEQITLADADLLFKIAEAVLAFAS